MRRTAMAMVVAGALTAAGCGASRNGDGAARPWHTMLAAVPATDATRASFVGIDAAAIRTQRGIKPPTGPDDLGDHLRAVFADGSTTSSRFVFGYFRKPAALAPEIGVAVTDIDRVVVAGASPATIDIAQGHFRRETVARALAGDDGERRRVGSHELITVGKAGELDPSHASTLRPIGEPIAASVDDTQIAISRDPAIVDETMGLDPARSLADAPGYREIIDVLEHDRATSAHIAGTPLEATPTLGANGRTLWPEAPDYLAVASAHTGEHGLVVVFVQRSTDDAIVRADRVRAVLAAERTSAGERLSDLLPGAAVEVDGAVVVLRAPEAPRGLWARLVLEHTSLLAANG